jgi:V/A-type H+-transporting ATPase subunit D
MEYLCELIAKDLQTTRRRVNALEYVLIPQIKGAIRFIVDKLNELERTNITQLMRMKQLMD